MPTAFSDACIHSFPHDDETWWSVSAVTGNGSPDEILSICLAQENREMYPQTHSGKLNRNKIPGSVRQWTLVALVKKTSLHFDCLKTTDILALAGYNMTWPAWALVWSQRYCMFINQIELYWIVTINKYFNMGCVTFRSPCITENSVHGWMSITAEQ
jgi:hypothetical protein